MNGSIEYEQLDLDMTEAVHTLDVLREQLQRWRAAGQRIGLVPTMGSLHAGHFSLLDIVRRQCDRTIVSIFVNPTQFGPNEDFDRYPRAPETDIAVLTQHGCDVVWLPSVETMYPIGTANALRVHAPRISEILEGELRPGHFDGVCTVVARLLNQVQPHVAVFGKKDYQQLTIIRRMVEDLAFPLEIVGAPIVRESDGLAMSSRNQYLSESERERASELFNTLREMRAECLRGEAVPVVETRAAQRLQSFGFVVDYAVVRQSDLSLPEPGAHGARVALIAARLGTTRLIDNLEFSMN